MLPLVDVYTLVGLETKKPIAYALAYGLASQLDTKVTLIDSGKEINVENAHDNLTIIPAKNLSGPADSLRVMNHYQAGEAFVINAPYEFLEDALIASERVSASRIFYQAISLLKSDYLHNLFTKLSNKKINTNNKYAKIGLTNLKKTLSFAAKIFSNYYKSNADFIKDEIRISNKALPLLREIGVPEGLTKKDENYLKQGVITKNAPLDELTINSLIIPVITGGGSPSELQNAIATAMYNEELSYTNNLLPYNILIDTYTNPTKKYLITQANALEQILIKTQFDTNEYEITNTKTTKDYTTETLTTNGQQLINKETLKKLKGTNTFTTKK